MYIVVRHFGIGSERQTEFLTALTGAPKTLSPYDPRYRWTKLRMNAREFPTRMKAYNAAKGQNGWTSPAAAYASPVSDHM